MPDRTDGNQGKIVETARGWGREDWESARDWLIAQGHLRWKGSERRLGTAWNLEAVSGWLNRSMQCATVQDSGES